MNGRIKDDVPASDGETGAGSRVGAGGRQLSIRDGRAGGDGSRELHDGNIVVVGSGRVGWVDLDGRNADNGSSRSAALL